MARRLLLLLSLLMVALVAWLMFPRETPESNAAAGASREAEATTQPSPEPDRAPFAPPPRREIQPVAASAAAGQPAPPVPADAQWIEVQVVEQQSRQPVADAEVAWLDGSVWGQLALSLEDRQWTYRDQALLAHQHGWRARSNAQGMVRVHVSEWTGVFGRSGTRYGSLQIGQAMPPPPEGYRLSLAEDRTLRVQVLDAVGQPAPGVPVAVAQHGADGAFLRLWQGSGAVARTGKPDGMATIPHMQEWREHAHGGQVVVPTAQWRVRLHVPGIEDPGALFDPKAPPAEPLVLRLPPCGSITARVELRGQIVTTVDGIGLHAGKAGDRGAWNGAWHVTANAEGTAHFPRVPLGVTYQLLARINVGTLDHEVVGPTVAGQDVGVVVPVADDYIVLSGRVLDDRHQLLPGAELPVSLNATIVMGGGTLRTDAHGRFLFLIGKAHLRTPRLERFVVTRQRTDAPSESAALAPRDLKPGVEDVGDLVLQPGALVVAGRFMAGTEPYPRRIWFQVERQGADARRRGGEQWGTVEGLTTTHGSGGAFEVRGEAAPGTYRLKVGGEDHLPVAPVEFTPGTSNLVVQVARGEALSASLLLPPAFPAGLEVWLVPHDAPPALAAGDQDQRSEPDRHRAFPWEGDPGKYRVQWQSVAAGTYTLAVRLRGQAAPLVSIPSVKVPSQPPDPRLLDIDLRELVAVLTVRLVGAPGRPRPKTRGEVAVFVGPLDPAAAEWHGHSIYGDSIRLPVLPGPVDLLVAGDGVQPRDIKGAREQVEVRLEPWPEQELRFGALPELPAGYGLHVTLRGPSTRDRGRYTTGGRSGGRESLFQVPSASQRVENGRAVLPIGTGPHRLLLMLRPEVQGGRSSGGRQVTGIQPEEVFAGPEPVVVQVPAEAVQKALRELQERKGR